MKTVQACGEKNPPFQSSETKNAEIFAIVATHIQER